MKAVAQLALDDGRSEHLATALFKQQDGHALFQVFTAGLAHDATAFGVHRQIDLGLLGLRVKAGLRIGQAVAAQDDLFFDNHHLAIALAEFFGAIRHRCATHGRCRAFGAVVDQAHLECGGAAQNVFGHGGVLHPRQLHHDAVQTLLLNDRLGHAQLVDAVVQGGDVLLQRLLLHAPRGFGLQAGAQLELAGVGCVGEGHIGKLVFDQVARGFQGGRVTQAQFNGVAIAGNAAVADVFLTQHRAQIARRGVDFFAQRSGHVHLQHEVHATAQVQAQVHGGGVERCEPLGGARDQVQGHHIRGHLGVGHQDFLDHVLGLELAVGVGQAHLERVVLQAQARGLDGRIFERLHHLGLQGRIDFVNGLGRRHLHGRGFAKKIGQGIEPTHQQSDHNDRVLPQRVTVHDRLRRGASGCASPPLPLG